MSHKPDSNWSSMHKVMKQRKKPRKENGCEKKQKW